MIIYQEKILTFLDQNIETRDDFIILFRNRTTFNIENMSYT